MKSNAIFSIGLQTLTRLDDYARTTEQSKSAVVRQALKQFMDNEEQSKKALANAVCNRLFEGIGGRNGR